MDNVIFSGLIYDFNFLAFASYFYFHPVCLEFSGTEC